MSQNRLKVQNFSAAGRFHEGSGIGSYSITERPKRNSHLLIYRKRPFLPRPSKQRRLRHRKTLRFCEDLSVKGTIRIVLVDGVRRRKTLRLEYNDSEYLAI